MDFHSMKRKELQALCKKHNIPANLTNLEMANQLTSLLKEKENTITRGQSCLKNMGELASENDTEEVTRKFKKVRFSPENEMTEFAELEAEPVETKRGPRRKSTMRPVARKEGFVIENVDRVKLSREIVENPVRTTRSREQKFLDGGVIPVLVPTVKPKKVKRGVRSDSMEMKDRGCGDKLPPIVYLSDDLTSDSSDVEETRVATRGSLRNREVLCKKSKEVDKDVAVLMKNQTRRSSKTRNAKTSDEISEDHGLAADGGITQPEKAVRRSKRGVRKVEDYALLNLDLGKNEMVGKGMTTRSRPQLAEKASAAESGMRIETKVEVHGMLLQLEEPSRRHGRNGNRRQSVMPQIEEVGTDGAKVENENTKPLRRSVLEDGSSHENLEENDVRPRRRSSRHEPVAISDGMDITANNPRKNKPRKRRRDPILEEESFVTGGASFVGEPPRRSTRNAAKTHTIALAVGTGKAVGREKLPNRSKLPNLEVEPLAQSTSAVKEPPIKPDIAESAIKPVLSSIKVLNNITSKKRKEFKRTSLAKKEVSSETSDFEEARAIEMENLVEIPASKPVKFQSDHEENKALLSVSGSEVVESVNIAMGVDKGKPLQDNISMINEDDLASYSCKRSRDFDSSNLVESEPEEGLNASTDMGFPQATSGEDDYSPVDRRDCRAKLADNLDLGNEMERDENPATGKHIDSSSVATHHGVDDDKASSLKEQNSVELEDSFGEPIEPELDVEDLSAESNEGRGSKENSENVCGEAGKISSVDLSDRERIIPSNLNGRERDEGEKSAVGADGQESANCSLRMLNIEVEALLTDNISAFKGSLVTDAVLSELEVADGASNPALSSSEKVSQDTDIKRKGTSRDSSLRKQHHSMEVGTKYLNEVRGLMMLNLEGTPASNTVKWQSDSVEQEREIPASETLVVTEKESIVWVGGNQNLFQDDMHKGNEYGLASWSQNRSGGFDSKTFVDLKPVEDLDDVGNVVITESTCGADSQSPVLQAEYVAKPASIMTLSDLEKEKSLSSKYTHSRRVKMGDYATGDDKCSVLEVQNFIEFQEVHRFAELSTRERVCEDHSTDPDGSEGAREDFENDSERAVDISALDPSHGERITPDMVELNKNEAEFSEGGHKMGIQLTTLIAPECQASPIGDQVRHSTGRALSIVNDAGKQGKVKENSNSETEFHHGIMSGGDSSDTFASDTGDKICSQQRIEEASAEMENNHGVLSVQRALHPLDEETGYEGIEGNSLRDGSFLPSLNELNGKLTNEEENAGSETNSFHNSDEIKEKSMRKFTNGKRISMIASVEGDTDRTEDTPAPIITPETSLVVNNEMVSSSEHTPLKDENGTGQEDENKTLFTPPANIANANEEASRQETEMDNARMQDSSTISNVKNGRLNFGEPQEVVGLTENEDEKMAYKENASPTASEEVTDEGSDRNADVEAGREIDINKTEFSGESAEGNEFTADFNVVGADTDCQCSEASTPHTGCYVPEYQASGTSNKQMSTSQLRLSVDNEMQDKGIRSSPNDIVNVPFIQSAIVTEAMDNGESIEGDLHVESRKLATEEENAGFLPEVEFWDPSECMDLDAPVNGGTDTGLAETPCKESEVSEEKIMVELMTSTSKCIQETNLPKEEENEGTLAPFVQMGIGKMVFDHGEEFETSYTNGPDASDTLADEDAKENVILAVTEADFDYKDSEDVLMDETSSIMVEKVEAKLSDSDFDKDDVVQELDKSTTTALDKLTDRKGDEDLVEISQNFEGAVPQVDEVKFNYLTGHKIEMAQELDQGAFLTLEFLTADNEHGEELEETSVDVAGTKLQVNEIKLDDLDSHKDVGVKEGNLNIKVKNSDAQEDVSPGYSDHYSEHEKVLKKASSSPLNLSDYDGQVSESHGYQGDLSFDAEGREVTEVDLFDGCGFIVSSLVSIDSNEDRGNAPTSMDKSYQQDKDVAKEKVVGDITDNTSSDAIDSSKVEDNVKSSQKLSKEELVSNEDALQEDAFVGGIGCPASNKPFFGDETNSIAEEADEVHCSLHNFNMVHCAGGSNQYAEQQNFSQACTSKPAVNEDYAPISSFDLAAYHGTMGYEASKLSLESNMFSSWEINMFLGDEVMKSTSGISETHFMCEDSVIASVTKENANVILSEEQLGKLHHLMKGKEVELNGSCLVEDESIFEGNEVSREIDVAKKSNVCRYPDNESVEDEKSSAPVLDMNLIKVSDIKGSEHAASVYLRVGGDFKCPEGESIANILEQDAKSLVGEATELCEAVSKSNSMVEDQSSEFTDPDVDGANAAEDAHLWQPNSELVKVKNPFAKAEEGNITVKQLNSTTMKRKNAGNSLIRGTPKKLITTPDMKENNAPSIKREHAGNITVQSTTKRRALEDLQNK